MAYEYRTAGADDVLVADAFEAIDLLIANHYNLFLWNGAEGWVIHKETRSDIYKFLCENRILSVCKNRKEAERQRGEAARLVWR